MLPILKQTVARVTYPTGNKAFSVFQAFPAGISDVDADPFLMCDHFGPSVSKGKIDDPDLFPVGWHPHRGQSLITYMFKGSARHADSMGNRENFPAPAIQWCNAGSGIEHAEGGGTPAGEIDEGFQIWVNMRAEDKMQDPTYGTHAGAELPLIERDGWTARIVAGEFASERSPYKSAVPIQILHVVVEAEKTAEFDIGEGLDNSILYVAEGAGTVNGAAVDLRATLRFDATDPSKRTMKITAGSNGVGVLLFSGKQLKQPIAWRGPIVMTTQAEIRLAFEELQAGTFLKKRAPWDYRQWYANPANHEQQTEL
jgi:quercetin 2,3-dioxygenase